MKKVARATVVPVALALALTGCAAPGASTSARTPVVAIATTTQLGSIVGDITACAGAASDTIMAPGVDPHEFSLSSDQVAGLTRAKLVIANGLGLEAGMQTALNNIKADGVRVYEVAPDLDPKPFADHDDEASEGEDHEHGAYDPHVFLDVARMAKGAENIAAQLAQVTGDSKYTSCGATVASELRRVDDQVRQTLAVVPEGRRVLITDHDAFGYFAATYGFTVAGVAVPGGSTDAEASSAQLAKVAAVVKQSKVPAIFSNTAVNPAVVEAIAKESGADVKVVPLFVDSVGGPGSGAETYSTMMLSNASAIANALK